MHIPWHILTPCIYSRVYLPTTCTSRAELTDVTDTKSLTEDSGWGPMRSGSGASPAAGAWGAGGSGWGTGSPAIGWSSPNPHALERVMGTVYGLGGSALIYDRYDQRLTFVQKSNTVGLLSKAHYCPTMVGQ